MEKISKELLDEKQLIAFKNAMEHDISIISGLSGAGKSYTALTIAEELKKEGWKVSRISPTGKAALRIFGKTIHSWLEPQVEEDKWGDVKIVGYKKEALEKFEAVIVDEASMIDSELWEEIMYRYHNGIDGMRKLIFVGDIAQLEPVGEGTPYMDAIKNDDYPNVELTQIHRNEEGNDIIDLAHSIRFNKEGKEEYNNVRMLSPLEGINKIKEDIHNIQAISPMKKGPCGTRNINLQIQEELLNERSLGEKVLTCLEWNFAEKQWVEAIEIFIGEKIVVTKNNFVFDLTNGTVAKVLRKGKKRVLNLRYGIYEEIDGLFVERDYDKEVLFIPEKFALKNLDLAYCLTVHKFQGSESREVVFFATSDQAFMLKNQKLVYTAVTRAKDKLWVVN